MPLFEYICEDCDQQFEKLIRARQKSDVHCPHCESEQVRKLLSTFVARGGSNSASVSGGCNRTSCPAGCSCGARH